MKSPRLDRLDYNAIINGAYDFAQRSSGATQSLSAREFLVHDRWWVDRASSIATAGGINITAQAAGPSGVTNYGGSARLVCDTVASTNNFHAYGQYIEGLYAAPLIGKKCVYQFYAQSNVAKNLNLVIGQGGSTNRRFGFDFQTESGLSWKKYQYAVDFGASGVGTPVLDTNISIEINFQLGQIGQATGAANGSWVTNVAPFFVAGKDTFMDNATNQLWFFGHLLRAVNDDQFDAVVNGEEIEMEHSRTGGDYDGELDLCKRYYRLLPHAQSWAINGTDMVCYERLDPAMRAAPLASVAGGPGLLNVQNGLNNTTQLVQNLVTGFSGRDYVILTSSYPALQPQTWYAQGIPANNGASIRLEAEM